jgi:bacterial/archaeal transporter family-2 protein
MQHVLTAIVLGTAVVLQVSINRQIALRWGLAPAVLLNALVLTAAASLFYVVARLQGGGGFVLRTDTSLGEMRWWWILPGVFGFALVTLLPWATHNIGFQRVFVALVATQLAASVLWDVIFERIPFSMPVAVAVVLAVACVALVSLR